MLLADEVAVSGGNVLVLVLIVLLIICAIVWLVKRA